MVLTKVASGSLAIERSLATIALVGLGVVATTASCRTATNGGREAFGVAAGQGETGDAAVTAPPVVGHDGYQRTTLEERLDLVDHVVRVSGVTFGQPRYNTSGGGAPPGTPSVNDSGWVRYRPITFTVTSVYKTLVPGINGLITLDWPNDERLAGFMAPDQYAFESTSEGVLLVTDFPAEASADPLVQHLSSLAALAPAPYAPAAHGLLHDWFQFQGGQTGSNQFEDETYTVAGLIAAIEAHLGPGQ